LSRFAFPFERFDFGPFILFLVTKLFYFSSFCLQLKGQSSMKKVCIFEIARNCNLIGDEFSSLVEEFLQWRSVERLS